MAGYAAYPAAYSGYPNYPAFTQQPNPYQQWPNQQPTFGQHATYPKPEGTPFIPPSMHYEDEDQPDQNPYATKRKSHRRSAPVPTPATPNQPLKSIMKKAAKSSGAKGVKEPADSRPPEPVQAKPKMKRPRAQSHPAATGPGVSSTSRDVQQNHIFVTFAADDELRFHYCSAGAVDEISAHIIPKWSAGVAETTQTGPEWRIRFRNLPWKSSEHAHEAIDLVIQLFGLFAHRGYTLQGAINMGSPPPRFVFVATTPINTHFFGVYLSRKGSRATIFKAPPLLDSNLNGAILRKLGSELAQNKRADGDSRIIDIKVNTSGVPTLSIEAFTMCLLEAFQEVGVEFETSVPLGRRRLGTAARRELLIFRTRR